MLVPIPIEKPTSIVVHYPPLSQLLTLGLHSRIMQNGPQTSSANVTSRCPQALRSGFLEINSTPNMRTYQNQGHTPPPGAVFLKDCCISELCPPRVITNPCWQESRLNYCIQNLSWIYISNSPFPYCTTALVSTTSSSSMKKLKILFSK